MMRLTRIIVGMGLVLLLGATACAKVTGQDPGADPGIQHPTGARDLVVRVEVGGGFLPVEASLVQIPGFSLFGNGQVVVTGPQIEIYPGPALPNLQGRLIDERGIQAILEAARDAGLEGPDRQYDDPTIADAGTTTFTVVADGDRHVTTAYALSESDDPNSDRAKLYEFSRKLGDLESWLPEGSFGKEQPFEFDALRVFVTSEFPEGGEELPQSEKEWPLSAPLSSFGEPVEGQEDLRCGVVAGPDLAELRPLAEDANQLTPWRSGEDVYHLMFRPLLRDESGC